MKLDIVKGKYDTFYYMAKTIRQGGKIKTVRVEKLGKHSELVKDYENPVEYLRTYVLKKTAEETKGIFSVSVTHQLSKQLTHHSKVSNSNLLNIGYFYLNAIYKQLNLNDFFKAVTRDTKIKYNPNDILKYLTFARILAPKSKLSTYDDFESYYGAPKMHIENIYRTLDLIHEHLDAYQTHLYKNSLNISNRNTKVLYYDCTNYFFEIETEDDFRKYGQSKDHKPNPIVQMGLFMDGDGVPLAFNVNPGNTNEQTTVLPLERQIIKDFKLSNFIYIADAGLNSNDIRLFNCMLDRDYIVTQSLKKLPKETQDLVLTDEHWLKLNASDKEKQRFYDISEIKDDDKDTYFKVMTIDNPIDIGLRETHENGRLKKKTTFKQQLIVTYNKKYELHQKEIRANQIIRADKLIKNNSISKTSQTSPKRFAKNIGDKPVYDLDIDKIVEENRYDGYYALVTSLENDSISDIIRVSQRRWEIEESFRILKTNFKSRPVYHQKDRRIISHFSICFTSLLVYRLLENKLGNKYTIHEIITQLKNMSVLPMNEAIFEASYAGSDLLNDLSKTFDIYLDKTCYLNTLLNKYKN